MSSIATEEETLKKVEAKGKSIVSNNALDAQQTKILESITELSQLDDQQIQKVAASAMALQNMKKNDTTSSPKEAQNKLAQVTQNNADELHAFKEKLAETLNNLFDKHDVNNDGVLDKEESLILVNHFVLMSKQMMKLKLKSLYYVGVCAAIDITVAGGILQGLLKYSFVTPESLLEDSTAAWLAVLDSHLFPAIDQACDKHGDEMLANAKDLKDAIFEELDTDEDGSVTKDEFVSHFHDLHHKYATFSERFEADVNKTLAAILSHIEMEVSKDLNKRINDRNCCTVM